MKIRSRLLIAFVIMTVIPVLITLGCVHYIIKKQSLAWEYTPGKTDDISYKFTSIINPIGFFYNMTLDEYSRVDDIVKQTPDKLLDDNFNKKLSKSMQNKNSYLIVLKNKLEIFNGKKKTDHELSTLPIADCKHEESKNLTYFDRKGAVFVKERTFLFTDKSLGQAFLISDYSSLQEKWLITIQELFIALFIVLVASSAMLTAWIYQSIIRPLNILRIATTEIGNGNLDEPINLNSKDEIGLLCKDFEEMRVRLKNMVSERLGAEENMREIMSNISHDLKTPITAIKGYTEGILDGVADTKEKQFRYLQTIYTKASDMTNLIDELSIYSKVEQHTMAYNFVSIPAKEYFDDCIDEFSLDLESHGIELIFSNNLPNDLNITIDAEQIHRVIQNIIGNAVKYMNKQNGQILITTEEVTSDSSFKCVQLSIEDNGPGIPEKDLPHLFDKFFRTDSSRNSSTGGSGLGLAIVKKIVEAHNGKVGVTSTLGVGSKFYFTIHCNK